MICVFSDFMLLFIYFLQIATRLSFSSEVIRLEQSAKYNLDKEQVARYIQQRLDANYRKGINSNYELIVYIPETSIRVWVNNDDVSYALHVHQAIEIIYPLEHGYQVSVGTEEYILKAGDILIIPSGEPHHLVPVTPDGLRLIFMVDVNILSKLRGFSYLTAYLSSPAILNYDTIGPLYDEIAPLLIKICKDFFTVDIFREMTVYSDLLVILSKYGHFRMAQDDNSLLSEIDSKRQSNLMARLNVVFDYLDEHYTEDISLEKLADIAGFSKFHFSRLFKQCTGHNFYDYLCYRRIKNAEAMLLKPGISITEIALYSGFSSLSTFNRTFKKLKNCTPTEYRSLYNDGEQMHPIPEDN